MSELSSTADKPFATAIQATGRTLSMNVAASNVSFITHWMQG